MRDARNMTACSAPTLVVSGSLNFPLATFGRGRTGWCRTEFFDDHVSITPRPTWLYRKRLIARPVDLAEVFPIPGNGFAFRTLAGGEWYLWTREDHLVAARLLHDGYPFTRQTKPARQVWNVLR
jgi:hypothetical protein